MKGGKKSDIKVERRHDFIIRAELYINYGSTRFVILRTTCSGYIHV